MDGEPKGVEELVGAAVARGEFDDLPCAGRPLDLDEYLWAPEEVRMEYAEGKKLKRGSSAAAGG